MLLTEAAGHKLMTFHDSEWDGGNTWTFLGHLVGHDGLGQEIWLGKLKRSEGLGPAEDVAIAVKIEDGARRLFAFNMASPKNASDAAVKLKRKGYGHSMNSVNDWSTVTFTKMMSHD